MEFTSSIRKAWEGFISGGNKPENIVSTDILSSWERSLEYKVNPFQNYISQSLNNNELKYECEKNEQMLKHAEPVMKYLFQVINGSNSVLTISDKNGYVLKMYGDMQTKKEAESINFFPGAIWSEEVAGTNAIGTVIEQKKPIQIVHTEHFCTGWHDWTCVSSPILNPLTKEVLGVIDISGKWKEFPKHTLGLVISLANNITNVIEKNLLDDIVQLNPFFATAVSSLNKGIIFINQYGNFMKINDKARIILGREIHSSSEIPSFKILLDKVLHGREQFIKQELVINGKHIMVSISPVRTNGNNNIGVIVLLKESKVFEDLCKRKAPPQNTFQTKYTIGDLIGSSNQFKNALQKAQKAAKVDSTLLITGETGVGKELFAQTVHSESSRKRNPFIAVNCGAIPRNLIESELFGYDAGSFTGANKKGKKGKFELANSGTIFLDEIGDMPYEVQVHLLRVLEERRIQRVGGDQTIPIDVRVIAATNKDLREAVKNGEFREDLLYRLGVIKLEIPSLKERKSDIPLLIRHYINKLGYKFGKHNIHIQPEVIEFLQEYSWPGNIRELRNVVEQMLFNMEEDIISINDLPQDLINTQENNEREIFINTLKTAKGNMSEIAEKMGISRATLYRKMKKFGITTQDLLS